MASIIAESLSARQHRPAQLVFVYIYIYIHVTIVSHAQECNYRLRHMQWYNCVDVWFCGVHLGTRSRLQVSSGISANQIRVVMSEL